MGKGRCQYEYQQAFSNQPQDQSEIIVQRTTICMGAHNDDDQNDSRDNPARDSICRGSQKATAVRGFFFYRIGAKALQHFAAQPPGDPNANQDENTWQYDSAILLLLVQKGSPPV